MKGKLKPNWTSSYIYVDAETGERIPKEVFGILFYKIGQTKFTKFNKSRTNGHTEVTVIGKRKPIQSRLF